MKSIKSPKIRLRATKEERKALKDFAEILYHDYWDEIDGMENECFVGEFIEELYNYLVYNEQNNIFEIELEDE